MPARVKRQSAPPPTDTTRLGMPEITEDNSGLPVVNDVSNSGMPDVEDGFVPVSEDLLQRQIAAR